MRKKVSILLLCTVVLFSLVACGSQEAESVPVDDKEYVYVPEYIMLEIGDYGNFTLNENTLYYSQYEYTEDMEINNRFFAYSLEDGTAKEIPIQIPEKSNVSGLSVDGADNLYVVLSDYSQENVGVDGNGQPDVFVSKYDSQGTVIFEKNITEMIRQEGEEPYIDGAIVDTQGRVYLCTQNMIFLLKENGEQQGVVETGALLVNDIGLSKDGRVYISHFEYGAGTVLSEIDFQEKIIGETYRNIPDMSIGGFAAGGPKDFWINDGSKLYEYELASETCEEVLTWLDSDINGSYVSYVGAMSDDTIVAVTRNPGTGATEIAKMVKTEADRVVQKEEIVVGSVYGNQTLQEAVTAFNKSNDKYRITIKTYIDGNSWDESTYNTALINLKNDIISSTNCPDILDLSQLGERQLERKGVFEDLTPYLEQSSVISKEDFLGEILDAYSYDGKLFAIPTSFYIETLIGKSSIVGENMGWSLEEMIACAKEQPDAVLMDSVVKRLVLNDFLSHSKDAFIDWEKEECYFNTDEFKQVLEFVATFPDVTEWDGISRIEKFQKEKLLLEQISVYDLQQLQVYPAQFGEAITYIGFPTADGSVGCDLYTDARYGITTKSKHKEGAWEFIESYLTSEAVDSFSVGFPVKKDKFEKMLEEVTTPIYRLDENGEPVLDENGDPIVADLGWISMGGWEYTYHTPTAEDVELLRALISVANPVDTPNNDIVTIILEEADAYFLGQKSLDEVCDIIQSRAQIYISENS